MILYNPTKYTRVHKDRKSQELIEKTINFFESKGLARIKADDQSKIWYDDFLAFVKKEHHSGPAWKS